MDRHAQLLREQEYGFIYVMMVCVFAFTVFLSGPTFGRLFKRFLSERKRVPGAPLRLEAEGEVSDAPPRFEAQRRQVSDAPPRFEAVVAAIMAYSIYIGAAILAGAAFPEFLREHLFDGLAPAALVGFLFHFIPRESPRTAFPRIRLPILIPIMLGIGGILIFGLIAAAAVFASGKNDFGVPIVFCAAAGGYLFSFGYAQMVVLDRSERIRGKPTFKWWFTIRHSPGDEPRVLEFQEGRASLSQETAVPVADDGPPGDP
jgi:hypothetical protein